MSKERNYYLFIDEVQFTIKVVDHENGGMEVSIYVMLNELKAYKNLDFIALQIGSLTNLNNTSNAFSSMRQEKRDRRIYIQSACQMETEKGENFMCGRYYVDDETAREIEKLVRQMNQRKRRESIQAVNRITAGDIYPGKDAPVLSGADGFICCRWQHWGFPGFEGKKLIFNARCESVLEKPMFRESIRRRRVVVPASWFYEWNSQKEKNTFCRNDMPVLFMAGFCRRYEDGEHFVILTTAANASMEPVHDRMPLILEQQDITEWILDDTKTEGILHKIPCFLERKTDYEQLSLF